MNRNRNRGGLTSIPKTVFPRRAFLQGGTAFSAATALGCSTSKSHAPKALDAGADAGVAGFKGFEVLKDIQDTLRGSPNFLPAAADRVVATKDPEKIFLFVRDNFVSMPASASDIGGPEQTLWGLRGTLRSGTGTLRDKADLLAELYKRAGLEATVVQGEAQAGPAVVERILADALSARPAALAIGPDRIDRWRNVLGTKTPSTPLAQAAPDADALKLGKQILDSLDVNLVADTVFALKPALAPLLPLVAVNVGGTIRYANPGLSDLPFGTSGVQGDPQPATAKPAPAKARFSLLLGTTTDKAEPRIVSQLEVDPEQLLGRSLFAVFVPPMSPKEVLAARLRDIRAFVPVLALRGSDLAAGDEKQLTKAGDAFTLEGEVMQIAPNGDVKIEGRAFEVQPASAAVLASVTKLDAVADASRFPDIDLRIGATDAQGRDVAGLTAAAFSVRDNADAQVAVLLENKVIPPRIVFIVDKSDSIPPGFLGAGLKTLVLELSQRVQKVSAEAQFRILVVGGRIEDTKWTKDPAAAAQIAIDAPGGGSDLWNALGAASELAPTVVVFITDGDPEFDPSDRDLAAVGPLSPTILLAVGPRSPKADATLTRMATLTGGEVIAATDTAQAAAAVGMALDRYTRRFYRLRYRAPRTATGSRNVVVGLRGPTVQGLSTYQAPAMADRRAPRRLSSLHLRIELPGQAPVTRLLAGVFPFEDATAADTDIVEAALFGVTELRFEGAPPTTAVMLDEIVTNLLRLAPTAQALRSGDVDKLIETFIARPIPQDGMLRAMHASVSIAGAPVTFPSALRVVAYSTLPRWTKGTLTRVDILPLGPHHTPAAPRAALAHTINATAKLALFEKALFPQSAAADLEGMLVPLSPAATQSLSEPDRARLEYLVGAYGRENLFLVREGKNRVAFYFVDRRTGATLAVGDTGAGCAMSGGGDPSLDTLNNGAALLGSIAGAAGGLGFGAGLIFGIYIGLHQKLIAATIVISGGTLRTDPSDFSDIAGNVAINVATGGIGAALGAGNAAARTAGGLFEIATQIRDIGGAAIDAACSAVG